MLFRKPARTLLFTALSICSLQACQPAAVRHEGYGDVAENGAGEDTKERLVYEWLRLHDPATGKIPDNVRARELAYAATLPQGTTLPQAGIASALAKTTAVSWTSRGPWNVGGRTRAMALDITDPNIILAGSTSGGMWRSTDGGAAWAMTTQPTQPQSVSCLTQDVRAGHTNVWYYGSGEAYGQSASATGAYYLGNGIYKSTDNGVSWSVLPATTSSNFNGFDGWGDLLWNVATDPGNTAEDEVYAAAYGGIKRSTDGGATWTAVLGNGTAYFTDLVVSPTGVVYASVSDDGGTSKGIWRSEDGVTWANITPAGFPAAYNRIKIGMAPGDENQVYFLANTPGYGQPDTNYLGDVEWNSFYKYNYLAGDGTGGGGAWRDFSSNLPSGGGPFDHFTTQGSYDIVVKVKPNDTNVVFIGGTNLYRSTSGFADAANTRFIGGYEEGATLPVVNLYPNHHPDQHELQFVPGNPDVMFSSNDGGVWRTDDNMASTVSWNSLNNGYTTTMFYTVALDHAGTNNVIIGGAQDNGSWFTNTNNATAPWVMPRGGDGSFCAIANNLSAYYFSIQQGKIMKAKLNSAGGVDSFARIDPIGPLKDDYLFINPFALDPNNSNNIMYLAGGKFLYRNNNLAGIPYAGNWDSISTNWEKFPDSVATQITAVAVSTNPANRVYYGTASRRVFRIDSANTSAATRTDITGSGVTGNFPTGYVSCIAVDPADADKVMVVFSNYSIQSLFYSSNGGTSWTRVGGNLESPAMASTVAPSCRWAGIIPTNTGHYYLVGTSTGLYATDSLQGTATVWVQQSPDVIGNAVIDQLDFRTTDGLVAIATHSHGIYSGTVDDVLQLGLQGAAQKPELVFSVFPNPFRNQATIAVTLPQAALVNYTLTDAAGRAVLVHTQGVMAQGAQRFTLNAQGLPAGMYYLTVRAGSAVSTKKVVVE